MKVSFPGFIAMLVCLPLICIAPSAARAVPQNADEWAKSMEAAFRNGKLNIVGKLMDQAVDDRNPGEAKQAHRTIADNIRAMTDNFGKDGPDCGELFDSRRIGTFFRRYDFAVCNGNDRVFFRFDLIRREKLGWLLRSWQASDNLDKIVNAPLPGNEAYDKE